jgi:hypothetical protein
VKGQQDASNSSRRGREGGGGAALARITNGVAAAAVALVRERDVAWGGRRRRNWRHKRHKLRWGAAGADDEGSSVNFHPPQMWSKRCERYIQFFGLQKGRYQLTVCVRCQRQARARLEAEDDEGQTPLPSAVSFGHSDVVCSRAIATRDKMGRTGSSR